MRFPAAATAVLGLFALLYALPVMAPGQLYALHILTLALCYAVPAIGLNLLFGYTGLVSLGHMGFAGVGAYTTALLMKNGIVGFAPALLAGAITAGMVGLPRLPSAVFSSSAVPAYGCGAPWRGIFTVCR